MACARSHLIYTDVDLNTSSIIYTTVYQNFLLSAMKMHGYLRDWGIDPDKNRSFVLSMFSIDLDLLYLTLFFLQWR
jgi:hypothetical protein